jgi:hypothetical protein
MLEHKVILTAGQHARVKVMPRSFVVSKDEHPDLSRRGRPSNRIQARLRTPWLPAFGLHLERAKTQKTATKSADIRSVTRREHLHDLINNVPNVIVAKTKWQRGRCLSDQRSPPTCDDGISDL